MSNVQPRVRTKFAGAKQSGDVHELRQFPLDEEDDDLTALPRISLGTVDKLLLDASLPS